MAQEIMPLSKTDNVAISFMYQQYASAQAHANRLFELSEIKGSAYLENSAQNAQNEADDIWSELDELGAFS